MPYVVMSPSPTAKRSAAAYASRRGGAVPGGGRSACGSCPWWGGESWARGRRSRQSEACSWPCSSFAGGLAAHSRTAGVLLVNAVGWSRRIVVRADIELADPEPSVMKTKIGVVWLDPALGPEGPEGGAPISMASLGNFDGLFACHGVSSFGVVYEKHPTPLRRARKAKSTDAKRK